MKIDRQATRGGSSLGATGQISERTGDDPEEVGFQSFLRKQRFAAERERERRSLRSAVLSWRATAPLWRLASRARALRRRRSESRKYQTWLGRYATVDEQMRLTLARQVDALATRPLISVIMPSYNVDPRWMRAAIESIRSQIYPHWELCISDDASTLPGVRELLDHYASIDSRIRVTIRASRGHISLNSNSALALAAGDYLALVDADDVIPEDALFWVAHEIALHPEVDLLFSDEDKIDENGRRFDPHFKPAWNPALMLSQNAFNHLGVLRRSLVQRVGGFREGLEGAQDHDLVLRCADGSSPDRIRHIPRVLYHWRSLAGSTASGLSSKPYATRAGYRALAAYLHRHGLEADIEPAGEIFYQLSYRTTAPPPPVSIVLTATGSSAVAKRRAESLRTRTSYRDCEIIVVSTADETNGANSDVQENAGDASIRCIMCEPRSNRAATRNRAAEQARGDVVCFLDEGVEPLSDSWLDQLLARVCLDGVAAAAPLLLASSGTPRGAGVLLGSRAIAEPAFADSPGSRSRYFGRDFLEQDFAAVSGECFAVRRKLFQDLGGFDPGLESELCNVDLCLRLRQSGARIIWTPVVRMQTSAVRAEPPSETEIATMRDRWSGALADDPAYNRNLSLDPGLLFELASPPRVVFPADGDPRTSVSRTSLF